jgi:hypothetical protein
MRSLSRQFHAARGAITSTTKKDRATFLAVSLLTFFLSQTFVSSYANSFIESKSPSTTFISSMESKKDIFRNIDMLVPNIVTTCISLKSRVHYILKSGACNPRIHESRAWYAKGGAPEGTPGAVLVDINICTSKKSGIQIVRKKCNSVTQTSTIFQRRHGQPAAPNIPTVKMATLGSAFISFSQPSDDGGANITHYTISSVPHSAEAIVFSHDKKIGHIANLLPGTYYQFAVSATNSQGTSLLSAHTALILAPDLPNKPSISNVKLLSDTSAKILFHAPDFDGGSEITSYSAVMNFEGGSRIKLDAKQLDTGIIEIAGLPYSSTFTISLFAHNVAGASLASEPSLSITTPPPPPPPPPPPCQVDPNAVLEITEAAIGGVSLPSTAATKPTGITSVHGYSGSISWSFSQLSGSKSSLADSIFGAMRTYTATIQLTPDCPKGKIKVPSNFFTISGANSVSNAENSGVITAVFPATGPGAPNKALIVTQPSGGVRGEILATQPVVRVTDIDDNTNTTYTGSVVASTGQLSGATVSAVSGIATYTSLAFTTSPNAGGTYEITFTPTGLISAISNSISILSAPSLSVETPTVGTTRRNLFTRAATILYSSTNFSGPDTVTATIAPSGSGCASTVAGTVLEGASEPVINGRATFSNLKIDGKIGDCYNLIFTSNRFNQSTGDRENKVDPLQGTVCNGSFTCQVGDTGPAGGKIFYAVSTPFACGPDRNSSCKYLEAAPSGWNTGSDPASTWAQSTPVNYQTTSVNNPTSPETATATAIGWGYWNTRAIVGQGNTNSSTAAALADSYTVSVSGNSYMDWFLPSMEELVALMNNALGKASASSRSTEGLSGDYWSASESTVNCNPGPNPGNGSCAIAVNDQGQVGNTREKVQKNLARAIRPIRGF